MFELINGDCLKAMQDIPDGSIDMVLCDLPYGTTQNKWDTVIPFEPLWQHYKRACKPNAAICLFGQMPFTAALVMSNPKMYRYEWVWDKRCATGFLNCNRMPMKRHELVSVFYSKLPTYNPQYTYSKPYTRSHARSSSSNYGKFDTGFISENNGERYPVDIVEFTGGQAPGREHPTQKPVPLLEYLIKTYTNKNETVLDNTMGSGSTGVACMNTGRNFIGIELDAGYFEIAKRRIEEAANEPRLDL